MSDVETNKRIAMEFYDLAFNQQKPAEAVSKYMGKMYRQHNPKAADGPEAFMRFVSRFVQQFPQLRLNVKRAIAEGDLVVLHVHETRSAIDRGVAVAEIFRLENGLIVEHWDVKEEIPEKSANNNTVF